MHKLTITDVPYGQAAGFKAMIEHAVAFLSKNDKMISLTERDMAVLKNMKSYATTPLKKLVDHIIDANLLSAYYVYDLNNIPSGIPEILTMLPVTVDGSVASVLPRYQKIWLNVSPFVAKKRRPDEPITLVNDAVPQISSMLLRGALCNSYNHSSNWLTPNLAEYIIKSYSMTVAGMLRSTFNLEAVDYFKLRTIFATYYAQLLGDPSARGAYPALLARCSFLGNPQDVKLLTEDMEEFLEDGKYTIRGIVRYLTTKGPSRLSRLNVEALYRSFSLGNADYMSMSIALDYPPYWVSKLINNVSGFSQRLISMTIKNNNMQRDVAKFADELNTSNSFIPKIKKD